MTTQEVADMLAVPFTTVQQWAARHKVDSVLKGRLCLFDRNDFRDFERPGNPGRPGRKAKEEAVSEPPAANASVE